MSDATRTRLLIFLGVAVAVLLGAVGFLVLRGDGRDDETAQPTTSADSSASTSTTTEPDADGDASSTTTSAAPTSTGSAGGGPVAPRPAPGPAPAPAPNPAPAPDPAPAPAPEPILLEAEIDGSSACTPETMSATVTLFWRTRNAASVRLIVDPPASLVTIDQQVTPVGAADFGPYFCGPNGTPTPWSARLIATAADGTVTERVFFGDHRD